MAGHMRTAARVLLVTVFKPNILCDRRVSTMSSTRNCLYFLKKIVTQERNEWAIPAENEMGIRDTTMLKTHDQYDQAHVLPSGSGIGPKLFMRL